MILFSFHISDLGPQKMHLWEFEITEKNITVNVLQMNHYLSLFMREPAFCICEKKDADQLRSNCTAYQHLCFCYTDSTIPLLSKSKISRL